MIGLREQATCRSRALGNALNASDCAVRMLHGTTGCDAIRCFTRRARGPRGLRNPTFLPCFQPCSRCTTKVPDGMRRRIDTPALLHPEFLA